MTQRYAGVRTTAHVLWSLLSLVAVPTLVCACECALRGGRSQAHAALVPEGAGRGACLAHGIHKVERGGRSPAHAALVPEGAGRGACLAHGIHKVERGGREELH